MEPSSVAQKPIRIAVVIPTYNNARTVGRVVADVKSRIADIIAVDDGSTDGTGEVLAAIPGIDVVTVPVNRGKGHALRAGFARARELGFSHAVTMDADGQHLARDIPEFIDGIMREPGTLWIGNRVLSIDGTTQPGRSRIGRRIGAFWYAFYTGIKLSDTQCGFRAYPVMRILELKSTAEKFEFELDVLIRAAWERVPVKEIPVHLFYLPKDQRVSHFRPFRDFLRLSLVNSKAAMTRIFMPWKFMEMPGSTVREKIYNVVKKEVTGGYGPKKSAASLAVGVLIGLSPFHLLQVIGIMAIAVVFRLSKLLGLLGVSISSAPLLPLWIGLGLAVGKIVLPMKYVLIMADAMQGAGFSKITNWLRSGSIGALAMENFVQYAVGTMVVAIIGSILTFAIAYPIFNGIARLRDRTMVN